MSEQCEIGYTEHRSLASALWAAIKRTVKTWRYAKQVGADPTVWWGVYVGDTNYCLASVGPLPGAEQRARVIASVLDQQVSA